MPWQSHTALNAGSPVRVYRTRPHRHPPVTLAKFTSLPLHRWTEPGRTITAATSLPNTDSRTVATDPPGLSTSTSLTTLATSRSGWSARLGWSAFEAIC